MAKVVFRRIGGRVVPITLETEVKSMGYNVAKVVAGKIKGTVENRNQVTVTARKGAERVGEVWGDQWTSKPHRYEVGAHLQPEFRGKGLGSEMYKMLAEKVKSLGGKSLHGVTENAAAISKVRGKIGRTRGLAGASGAMKFVTLVKKLRKP